MKNTITELKKLDEAKERKKIIENEDREVDLSLSEQQKEKKNEKSSLRDYGTESNEAPFVTEES